MLKSVPICLTLLAASLAASASAEELLGTYLESRSCDVYTGPCFANGEMGMAGKEALLAWKVEDGTRNGIALAGLSVALVLKAENTLGDDGVFAAQPGNIKSVILVDDRANTEQQAALVDFVKQTAANYTQDVQSIEQTPMKLESNFDTHESVFEAGKVAKMETRRLNEHDCVCTNETAFYQPLVDVRYASPAFSVNHSYTGNGLDTKWNVSGSRSSYIAAFRN